VNHLPSRYFGLRGWIYFRFYLDLYYWPQWYAINLWLLAFGQIGVAIVQLSWMQRIIHFFYAVSHFQKIVWYLRQTRINRMITNFMLRRKIGKWLLRRWINFWYQIISKPSYCIWGLVFVSIFIITFIYSEWLTTLRNQVVYLWNIYYRFLYDSVYMPYYYAPMANFIYNGEITGKLFITPVTTLLAILWLLRLNQKIKNKKKTA
jgi:hypothetical protein